MANTAKININNNEYYQHLTAYNQVFHRKHTKTIAANLSNNKLPEYLYIGFKTP